MQSHWSFIPLTIFENRIQYFFNLNEVYFWFYIKKVRENHAESMQTLWTKIVTCSCHRVNSNIELGSAAF